MHLIDLELELKKIFKKTNSKILEESNFENIKFSEDAPYWCCVGYKKK